MEWMGDKACTGMAGMLVTSTSTGLTGDMIDRTRNNRPPAGVVSKDRSGHGRLLRSERSSRLHGARDRQSGAVGAREEVKRRLSERLRIRGEMERMCTGMEDARSESQLDNERREVEEMWFRLSESSRDIAVDSEAGGRSQAHMHPVGT